MALYRENAALELKLLWAMDGYRVDAFTQPGGSRNSRRSTTSKQNHMRRTQNIQVVVRVRGELDFTIQDTG